MDETVRDETSIAVGSASKDSKRRPGRPRIHADDAARKRAFNQRRAEANARARAAERRAKRWEAEARELRGRLELAGRQYRTSERQNAHRESQLLAKIARLEEQLARATTRKEWAVARARSATAEVSNLRGQLARAERAVRAYGADDRLDKLQLKARIRELEQLHEGACRAIADLRFQLQRSRTKRNRA